MIRIFLTAVAVVVAIGAPFVVTDLYFQQVMVIFGIYAIFAVALDILFGFLGVHSFGHAAFFGGGAYVCGILMETYGVSFGLSLVAATVLSALLGLLVAIPALRMRGIYFAITTLFCAEVVRLIVTNVPSVTRGTMGLTTPLPSFPGVPYGYENLGFYYLTFAVLALSCFLLERFRRSPLGRSFIAIRENEQLAASVGVPVFRIKFYAFGVSGGLAGLAGAIYAPFIGIISPDLLSPTYSAMGMLMVVVGGFGTIYGAIFGAFMFSVVTEIFRAAAELRMIIFSALLIAAIIFMPRGVLTPLIDYLRRPSRREPAVLDVNRKDEA
ncbi:branched-chain amino acid ABC transporter permease [Oryzicola mucosus]|uniref:Branched-chain amino acid ABC transporter permease n=1 Tax=Oryzicola mucosus TaxID=2767425 RepID=A0A8J6U3I4_9HYPH|nr:branched-chain amino acid ABC transporter permease [Oryzicola mucosus]MBD0416758.1 branched-chain amino acid ABC transporter permease [Oryzicola mucosus]